VRSLSSQWLRNQARRPVVNSKAETTVVGVEDDLSTHAGFARPGNRCGDIRFADAKSGELGAYFIGATLLQWAQNNAFAIRAHIKVFHTAEAGHHRLGRGT
jgi:hypothetical protein